MPSPLKPRSPTPRSSTAASVAWSDWFPVFAPHLAAEIAHPEAVEAWCERLRGWPARGPAVLEVRLGPEADPHQLDISLRLDYPAWATPIRPRLASHPSIDFLVDGWRRLGHPDPIPSVWLELDASPSHRAGTLGDLPLVIPRLSRVVDPAWMNDTLTPALGIAAASRTDFRRGLERAMHALPSPARVLYVFSLAARGNDGVRIETIDLPVSAMGSTVGRLAGPSAARQLAAVTPLVEGGERPHLSFDLLPDGGVGERLGLEVGFRRQPRRQPGWDRLLARWVGAGLCTPQQRHAILAWCGQDHLRSAVDRWPEGALGHCVRCLSHFKVVCHRHRGPELKAYLLCENVIAR